MVNPVPGYRVTTAYRKSGSWSCGYHTGQDYAAPNGATVVAARAGAVVHTTWGSSFGDRQFAIRASDGTYDFYAHTNTRPGNGATVSAGHEIAQVGARGNATGPHLHFERRTSNAWSCSGHQDPMTSHNAGGDSGSGGQPTYLSKLRHGQRDSDSVKNLQAALNGHSMPPRGRNLPVTGNYLDQTDAEVRLCQELHGYGNDKPGESFVGPRQAAHLGLPDVRDDRDNPV